MFRSEIFFSENTRVRIYILFVDRGAITSIIDRGAITSIIDSRDITNITYVETLLLL